LRTGTGTNQNFPLVISRDKVDGRFFVLSCFCKKSIRTQIAVVIIDTIWFWGDEDLMFSRLAAGVLRRLNQRSLQQTRLISLARIFNHVVSYTRSFMQGFCFKLNLSPAKSLTNWQIEGSQALGSTIQNHVRVHIDGQVSIGTSSIPPNNFL
jgi:hypothetical protein